MKLRRSGWITSPLRDVWDRDFSPGTRKVWDWELLNAHFRTCTQTQQVPVWQVRTLCSCCVAVSTHKCVCGVDVFSEWHATACCMWNYISGPAHTVRLVRLWPHQLLSQWSLSTHLKNITTWTIGTSNCLKHISLCALGKTYPTPFHTFVPVATPLDRTNMNRSAPGLNLASIVC